MERLPAELCSRIFSRLDDRGLATALQVCRKWKRLASDDALWSRLFADRWGAGSSRFYTPAPDGSKSWKDMYEVQDRCDRIGVDLKIIREGEDYYVVYQGEIQRFLGSRREKREAQAGGGEPAPQEVSEKMLFFLADLETACAHARRTRRRL